MTLCSVIAAITFFILPAPVTLFDRELNPVVELPAGYFVMLDGTAAPDGYLSVVYDDLAGLVRASDVEEVDYRPVTKYETTARFRCDNDGQPVNLRERPQRSSRVLTVMDAAASGRLYGAITGDSLITGCGNIWYYVEYAGIKGYCYCAHVSVDQVPPNIIEKEPEPEEEQPTSAEPADEQSAVPTTAAIILIIALCIPVPFIMFYMFKKPKE